MKKILAIILFIISFKAQSQVPQAPIIFTSTTQMVAYTGSYNLALVVDTGFFYKINNAALVPDFFNIYPSTFVDYYWVKQTTPVGSGGNGVAGVVLDTMALLANFSPQSGIYVTVLGFHTKNDGGGGSFWWNDTSTATVVNGMIVKYGALDTGRWHRLYEGSKLNVLWFGAKPDSGITNNTDSVQAAADYAKQFTTGNHKMIVYFPHGVYGHLDPIHWWSYIDIEGESQQSTMLWNYNTTSLIDVGQVNIFFGELTPFSWDRFRVKDVDSIKANRMYLHNVTDKDSFAVDSMIFARGLTSFVDASSATKYFWFRLNVVDSIVQEGSKWVVVGKYDFDSTFLTPAKVSMINALPIPNMDDFGYKLYAITDVNVSNIAFKSAGQWRLRTALLKSHWENVTTDAAEGFSGNLMQDHSYEHCTNYWWKQGLELAYNTNHAYFNDVRMYWKNNTALVVGIQPIIRFGENTAYATIENCYINAGQYDGGTVNFDDAIRNIFSGNVVIAPYCVTGVEFNNNKDSVFNYDNTVERNIFTFGRTVEYVDYVKNTFSHSVLNNDVVRFNTFKGALRSGAQTIVHFGGTNNIVHDNTFENGNVVQVDALTAGCHMWRNDMLAPFQKFDVNVLDMFENYRGSARTLNIRTDSADKSNIGIGYNKIVKSVLDADAFRNIAIGNFGVQDSLGIGDNNIAIGDSTLSRNQAGSNLMAIGYKAFKSVRLSNNSIAIGTEAMGNISQSTENVAIGYQAMVNSPISSFSVVIGAKAGTKMNDSNNVVIGSAAYPVQDTGEYNVAIGRRVGESLAPSTFYSNVIVIGGRISPSGYRATNEMNLGGVIRSTGITSTDSTMRNTTLLTGIGGAPIAGAALSVQSTTGGFLMPTVTLIQRNAFTANPTGNLIVNTTANAVQYYNGTDWQNLLTSYVPVTATDANYTASAQQFIRLPLITADRNIIMPSALVNVGLTIKVWNTTNAFHWFWSGETVRIFNGSAATQLSNEAVYTLTSNGVEWVITSDEH